MLPNWATISSKLSIIAMIFVNSLGQKSLWLTHQQVEHHGGNVDNHPRLGGSVTLMINVDD